ncbi:ABC transporter substrate-binding protein [Thiomonas sp.]|uniref:ABC transporter substrate-binding protein n=1 Tax=Thiomonas sp. TaxID=2047785 RepID=UPI00261C1DD4|nr:ABC transporter substrate-binding protein [Thiomonas sp.]
MSRKPDPEQTGVDASRRQLVALAGASAATAAGSLLPAVASAAAKPTLKIGFISPLTGPLGGFGEADPFVLDLVRKKTAGGVTIGGTTYAIELIGRDTQSDPSRASQLAKDLINNQKIDLMLTTSTPEVVNPVADACEASGMPCLSTVDPWESWYFGRGAKPGQPSPFKWTYHFSFGTEEFAKMYLSTWALVPTNKKVGVLYPNDADGNALRAHLVPELKKGGYTIVDPGAYQDGTTDFSSQISRFKSEGVQIITGAPIPPDFITFLRQAAQQGLVHRLKIVMPAKFGLFPSDIAALGELGYKVASGAYWSPAFPYVSPVVGLGGQQLVDAYEKATGKQWTQQLGASLALIDAGFAALKASGAPKDKAKVAAAMKVLDTVTTVGRINFPKGPVPNVATAPIIGSQWVKAKPGSRFKLAFPTVEHADDPKVAIQAKLLPYA